MEKEPLPAVLSQCLPKSCDRSLARGLGLGTGWVLLVAAQHLNDLRALSPEVGVGGLLQQNGGSEWDRQESQVCTPGAQVLGKERGPDSHSFTCASLHHGHGMSDRVEVWYQVALGCPHPPAPRYNSNACSWPGSALCLSQYDLLPDVLFPSSHCGQL